MAAVQMVRKAMSTLGPTSRLNIWGSGFRYTCTVKTTLSSGTPAQYRRQFRYTCTVYNRPSDPVLV
jgi:hypothetical protein